MARPAEFRLIYGDTVPGYQPPPGGPAPGPGGRRCGEQAIDHGGGQTIAAVLDMHRHRIGGLPHRGDIRGLDAQPFGEQGPGDRSVHAEERVEHGGAGPTWTFARVCGSRVQQGAAPLVGTHQDLGPATRGPEQPVRDVVGAAAFTPRHQLVRDPVGDSATGLGFGDRAGHHRAQGLGDGVDRLHSGCPTGIGRDRGVGRGDEVEPIEAMRMRGAAHRPHGHQRLVGADLRGYRPGPQ
nr:hypothetical protein [Nocardia cyriacigeorgica]